MLVTSFNVTGQVSPPPSHPLRVAICGEVSSGKSTLLNILLQARVLPDNIGKTSRPLVRLTHGSARQARVTFHDGTAKIWRQTFAPAFPHNAEIVDICSDNPHLAGINFVEVPLTETGDFAPDHAALIRSSDVMIWTTIASQAWRYTEKTLVEAMGEARPRHCILAVSRADKLRNPDDGQRLRNRLLRETSSLFQRCVFLHGGPDLLALSATSKAAWVATGGAEITEILRDHQLATRGGSPNATPILISQ